MNLFELAAKISMDTRDYEKAVKNATKVSKSLKDIMERSATQSETNKNKIKVLASEYSSAKAKVATLTTAFNKAAKEEGITAERTKQLAKELQEAEKESNDLKGQLDELTKKSKKAGDGFSKLGSALGKGLKTAGKIGVAAVGAAAAGITALTTAAVNNYAEYEQLVGGVQTLFGLGGQTLEEYAATVGKTTDEALDAWLEYTTGERIVLNNSEKAFRTAGMSANEYMATVTGFSAALLQGLGGDTKKAAEIADLAVTDMADNANKMGTSMELIQNAYQGFAKDNFTMLDNLKLGYGGTAGEMARLINDSGVLGKSIKVTNKTVADVPFDKVIEAINVIQTRMGITGTTAKEAGRTIAGSVGAMKSAWTNLVTGFADGNADIETLIENLVETIVGDGTENNLGVIGNVLPAIKTALGGVGKLVEGMAPIIEEALPTLIKDLLPSLLRSGTDMIFAIVRGLIEAAPAMYSAVKEAVIAILENVFGVTEEQSKSFFSSIENAVGKAVNLLKSAYSAVSNAIDSVIQGFKDAVEWGKEHETALTLIGIAIGTVTAAIAAYNIAQAIQNAGGIAAIAQMVLMKVQMVALTVAQAAQTAATWVATTATTAFGAAMAFLTSPITLVVAGIGALIAIIVLCVKHWDDIKKAASNAWEWIKGVWSNVASWFDEKVLQPIKDMGKKFADIGKNIVDGLKSGIKNAWNNLVSWFKGLFGDLIGIAKKILGIASPSKVFKKLGSFTADGFGIGFEDEFAHVKDDMEDALNFDDASVGINASIRKVGAGAAGGAFGGTSIGNININIDGAKYSDEQSLASAIALEIQNMTDRRAAVYA